MYVFSKFSSSTRILDDVCSDSVATRWKLFTLHLEQATGYFLKVLFRVRGLFSSEIYLVHSDLYTKNISMRKEFNVKN